MMTTFRKSSISGGATPGSVGGEEWQSKQVPPADEHHAKAQKAKWSRVCDFALNDAALFLDTHPDNQTALAFYRKHLKMKADAVAAYIGQYGPLNHSQYDGGPRWTWADGPWPWQNEEA